MACEAAGLKYIHGVEVYLTASHEEKVRDNYHTILLAKNAAGLKEINTLVSNSTKPEHFYYKPRISFDEFFKISNNVIKISACLASPLANLDYFSPLYEKLVKHYDYLEIQPHNCDDQRIYNYHLYELSKKYNKPLIAGTDTHNLNDYKAECRKILKISKHMEYANEDDFDLTYQSYEQLCRAFEIQNALPKEVYLRAIEETNEMAASIEEIQLDTSFKYPILYGSPEADKEMFYKLIDEKFQKKIDQKIIAPEHIVKFQDAIKEECRVFEKLGMCGFMLFMSELISWCKSNDIPVGPGRGSCCGSRVAFILDIIDVNPEVWHTVFSRFCNEDRLEIGDIDCDWAPDDRVKAYEYIINRIGVENTAYILAIGTISDKGTIDEIGRALHIKWCRKNLQSEEPLKQLIKDTEDKTVVKDLKLQLKKLKEENEKKEKISPYKLSTIAEIKKEYDVNPDKARKNHPDIFYYFDGLVNTKISQSVHPAGIVASPITLSDNYGTFYSSDGLKILQIDMEEVHEVSLVKYDVLGLKNIAIIRDSCKLAGIPYLKTHKIDWEDPKVWEDMKRSPVGIFQFEGSYSFQMLCKYDCKNLFDMSLVTAAIRPSGASYRNDLIAHKPFKNPSPMIDELLKDNNGYLIYQEDTIKFLTNICGLSGSEADNIRRAIGRKDRERLEKAMPLILEGYCNKSPQPREIAEQEAKVFLKIIEDSASYQFGANHSIAYCMIGYMCAWLRCYYPYEFITAFLNNAQNEEDIRNGSELAALYGIQIMPPRYGYSASKYMYDKETKTISKGVGSVKYLNDKVADALYLYSQNNKDKSLGLMICDFVKIANARQLDILIKIDYFTELAKYTEFTRLVEELNYIKYGASSKISKEKVPLTVMSHIDLSQYCDGLTKAGKEAKSWTIIDMNGLIKAIEKAVHKFCLPDSTLKEKMEWQKEYLGYVDLTTGKQEDVRKLLITDMFALKSKRSGHIWSYVISTRSLGTGKTSNLTVYSDIYEKNPIKIADIIYAESVYQNERGYWYLDKYHKTCSNNSIKTSNTIINRRRLYS